MLNKMACGNKVDEYRLLSITTYFISETTPFDPVLQNLPTEINDLELQVHHD